MVPNSVSRFSVNREQSRGQIVSTCTGTWFAGPPVTGYPITPSGRESGHGVQSVPASDLDVRPPLVRSPVYVFRAIVGLVLVAVSVGLLLIFEQGLVGMANDVADLQAGWPDWFAPLLEVLVGIPKAIGIIGTNVYLLYRRKYRRWVMINLAVVVAFLLGALVTSAVLALASDTLREVVEGQDNESLGNDGLASVVAVLTIGSVWIGPRLRPWVVGFVAAALGLSFFPDTTPVLTLPLDIGLGIVAGASVALLL
jgi:hypothetical protein